MLGMRYIGSIIREIVVTVKMHHIQGKIVQLFKASDRLDTIGLGNVMTGSAREWS